MKELIVAPKMPRSKLDAFFSELKQEGIKTVYTDPKNISGSKLDALWSSKDAKYVIIDKDAKKIRGKKIGRRFKVGSNLDIDEILVHAKKGLDFVIIEVKDWKIIPLENIIAKLHRLHTRILAIAKDPSEVRKMFSILDIGVDGVIFDASSISKVKEALLYMGTKSFKMQKATITEIKEVGDGERVCVDTASMLHRGEGMLIGNRSNFMFLVHNESVGSSFTSPRPFRVNAGAVHCYTLGVDGTTKYLSEVETGTEVLVLDSKGKARRVTVGRSKIERRPMLMIKAKVGSELGGIIAQDAETIRFIRSRGDLVSVTHLKKGDTVLVYAKPATGRHFGMEVSDEYILEK
ncbi:MAG: 3-dehydroquinate synthase [Cenarchaeum symbiont of Oopsacas minuta]|nr:3-dehydroquinate synthase [Cenarchaeum symbiont of Oopsacas minuta]